MTRRPISRRRIGRLALAAGAALTAAGCSPLVLLNAAVSSQGWLSTTGVRYGAGPRRRLDVYRPRGVGPFSVVVWFYGGGWDSGERGGYEFVGVALARQGFVTVIPDYTLSPDGRYPEFLEDGAAAVAWTLEHIAEHGGDPARLALMGHSAGAYNAAMLAYDRRWLGAAGVPADAVKAFVGLSGPYEIFPYTVAITRTVFGHVQDDGVEPMTHVEPGAPPALLIHGGDDGTVDPRNAPTLAEALRRVGTRAEVVTLPDAGHVKPLLALSPPLEDAAVLRPVVAFLESVLGPTAPR
ncbi:alpha/beta hydrolase [Caenispirillum bisanense]|uniref:Acetyl esterase/lipase n=1 Tax=Caenispirillum bisanense TaxID=414052 RepID=A0A286GIT2_9PROT|nr:alpha/beta hydrolase [Caenispirillum bisanense]SOD95382.1 Acetyl esterase/lipase [Caenispirillum bisanense]